MSRTIIIPLLLILGASAAAASNGTVMECPRTEDINETRCKEDNNTRVCPLNMTCGDYQNCPCRKGFHGSRLDSKIVCDDINECTGKTHTCGANTECRNLRGSFYCECNRGFHKDNKTKFCPDFSNKANNKCEDINECNEKTHTCGENTECRNTPGNYSCKCNRGFHKDDKIEFSPDFSNKTNNNCEDINECGIKTFPCGKHVCRNTPGAYFCTCTTGFRNTALDPKEPICVAKEECKFQPSICGLNSKCAEEDGSYKCLCDKSYRKLSVDDKNQQCVFCRDDIREVPCEGNESNCLLQNLNSSAIPTCSDRKDLLLQRLLEFLNFLGKLLLKVSSMSKEERLKLVGFLLPTAERLARILAILHQNNITLMDTENRTTLAVLSNFSKHERVSLLGKWSRVTLDGRTAVKNNTKELPMVGFLEYHNLTSLLKDSTVLVQNSTVKKYSLVSPVISTFLTHEDTENLSQPITVVLTHNDQVKDYNQTVCAFWSEQHKAWSRIGCRKVDSTEEETVCECTHMTSFAILLALQDIESWTLSLITKIGLSLSIICLTLALITFCFCRSIRGTRNTIHTHLCATLLLGNCVFLLGISAYHNYILCGVVAGVLHALYLSSFCWMALEGLELYLMLVRVFDTHSLKKRHLVMVGYGVPLIIIIISAAIYPSGYGTKTYCWLSRNKGFIWSFMAPVCVIILVNCCIFILTVWKLAENMASLNPDQGKLKRISQLWEISVIVETLWRAQGLLDTSSSPQRSLTVTSVAQLCILGCCWLFGFLMFGEGTYVFAYIFSILNCLQGLQIFLLHCLKNKKVREEYAKWLCAAVHFKTPTYSEFSNTSNTHTQSKLKTANKESNL